MRPFRKSVLAWLPSNDLTAYARRLMGTRAHTMLAQTVMVAARAQDETASISQEIRTECCQRIPIQCSHRLRERDDSIHAVRSVLPLEEWRSARIFTLNAQAPEVAPSPRHKIYVAINEIKPHSVSGCARLFSVKIQEPL
ncbi:hypothetical protein NDU88_000165 [Pleurodeles waltl]|uniref:Uncharacterized protein n=1 Tax=Pleurodeles waltl TaxID=8319 RepID=A0AAV7L612_PLEWA|nr:hypothetical protein NDU88_000165 [Pleurodeles waltl]